MKDLIEKIKSIRIDIDVLASAKKEIQEKMSALEEKEQFIRDEILKSMSASNKKYENLEGLAEIKVQKTARAYETVDEKALIEFLKSMGRYDDIVKTTVKVSSAPLTKFLDELRSADAIPKCVKLKESEDSLRISFSNPDSNSSVMGNQYKNESRIKSASSTPYWTGADEGELDSL